MFSDTTVYVVVYTDPDDQTTECLGVFTLESIALRCATQKDPMGTNICIYETVLNPTVISQFTPRSP